MRLWKMAYKKRQGFNLAASCISSFHRFPVHQATVLFAAVLLLMLPLHSLPHVLTAYQLSLAVQCTRSCVLRRLLSKVSCLYLPSNTCKLYLITKCHLHVISALLGFFCCIIFVNLLFVIFQDNNKFVCIHLFVTFLSLLWGLIAPLCKPSFNSFFYKVFSCKLGVPCCCVPFVYIAFYMAHYTIKHVIY